jgi:hypothetical protein
MDSESPQNRHVVSQEKLEEVVRRVAEGAKESNGGYFRSPAVREALDQERIQVPKRLDGLVAQLFNRGMSVPAEYRGGSRGIPPFDANAPITKPEPHPADPMVGAPDLSGRTGSVVNGMYRGERGTKAGGISRKVPGKI